MIYSIDEHELRLDGLPREHLDFDEELSEAEISVSIIDYERNIRESCVYDPAFSGKISDIDAVAVGPDMEDIHTSREKFSISSLCRTYNYICKLLEALL